MKTTHKLKEMSKAIDIIRGSDTPNEAYKKMLASGISKIRATKYVRIVVAKGINELIKNLISMRRVLEIKRRNQR